MFNPLRKKKKYIKKLKLAASLVWSKSLIKIPIFVTANSSE